MNKNSSRTLSKLVDFSIVNTDDAVMHTLFVGITFSCETTHDESQYDANDAVFEENVHPVNEREPPLMVAYAFDCIWKKQEEYVVYT